MLLSTVCLKLMIVLQCLLFRLFRSQLKPGSFYRFPPTHLCSGPQELHRVLKPGGAVAILDFNNAGDNFLADQMQAWRVGCVWAP